jgi:hypothetical protein
MDSGASMHISFDVTNFMTLELNPRFALPTVTFGDNNQLTASGIRLVQFQLPGIDGPSTTMILDDVLHIPQAAASLFSVKNLAGHGQAVVFSGDRWYIYKDQVLLFRSQSNSHNNYLSATLVPGPFTTDNIPTCPTSIQYCKDPALVARVFGLRAASPDVWHARLGHLGLSNMDLLISKDMVTGFPITRFQLNQTKDNPDHFCEPCVMANSKRFPSPTSLNPPSKRILELLHTDIDGPLQQILPYRQVV